METSVPRNACRASALAFPDRPRRHSAGVPLGLHSRAWSFHACSLFCDSATPKEQLAIYAALPCCLPHQATGSARRTGDFRLNTRPTCASVNASPRTLPPRRSELRPEWLARPSPYGSFIRYSMPVYPGAFGCPRRACAAAQPVRNEARGKPAAIGLWRHARHTASQARGKPTRLSACGGTRHTASQARGSPRGDLNKSRLFHESRRSIGDRFERAESSPVETRPAASADLDFSVPLARSSTSTTVVRLFLAVDEDAPHGSRTPRPS